jgi:hypothetical protein
MPSGTGVVDAFKSELIFFPSPLQLSVFFPKISYDTESTIKLPLKLMGSTLPRAPEAPWTILHVRIRNNSNKQCIIYPRMPLLETNSNLLTIARPLK